MYKINDHIIYKHDLCKIIEIRKINDKTYYRMVPITDSSLIIDTPINNSFIRNVISKENALNIIKDIPNIEPIDDINIKNIDICYKQLLNTGEHKNLIKIIKTSYLRNENRINNNKKISYIDETYFNIAENYLYNELGFVLNLTNDEIKQLIIDTIKNSK